MERVYGTCVAIDGRAVLLRGPSGSGKSDLALRLIDTGGRLVADDQTVLVRAGCGLVAACPAAIAGRIEVRGLGLLRVEAIGQAPLVLVFDLARELEIERLPEPGSCAYLGVSLPLFRLAPFEASAVAKVRIAMHAMMERCL